MTTNTLPTYSANSHEFDESLKNGLESLLSMGRDSGADFVEIFLENTNNLGIMAEQESITSVNPSFSKGAGVRVFLGERDGFVSTNDTSTNGIQEALIQALGMLDLQLNNIRYTDFEGLKNYIDYGYDKNEWYKACPDLQEVTTKLLAGNRYLSQKGQDLEVRRSSYSRAWQEVLVASSDGTFARDIRLHQSIGLNALAASGQYRSSIGRRYGTYGEPNQLKDWDCESSADDVCRSIRNMLFAEYVEASQMPVVLANKFGGVIFHEACGHLLETTQLERGTSPFAEKLNKKIAHECVTAIDEGLSRGSFGSISMDDEGMPAEKTTLIKDGILKRFMSDRAGELRTGHKRTGSGRRQSHSFPAASRMRNTFIAAGEYKPEELINSIDKGLYCKSMGGGSVGPTGQFNFAVEEAYLIDKGKLTNPVKGATLIGEAQEVLPRISMCADDLDLAAGFCGSVSGNINVTVGQPHIKVDSITIGGR